MSKGYRVNAKAVWHLHIGAGDEHKLDPLGYVIKEIEGKHWFYRIDVSEMMTADSSFANEFVRLTEKENSIGGLRKLIIDAFNPDCREMWIHRAAVSERVWKTYNEKVQARALGNQLLVQCMPYAGGQVYIPGSSIKGALRTAVLDTKAEKIGYLKVVEAVKKRIKHPRERSAVVEKILLGFDKIDNDPFKSLKVQDVFLPTDSTVIVEVMNVPKGGKKPISLDMFVEAIRPGTEFEINLSSENNIGMQGIDIVKKRLTIEDILSASGEYFINAIAEEADEHYDVGSVADKAVQDALCEVLDEDSKVIPGTSLVRIGRFSHLESMTYAKRGKGCLCQPKEMYNERTGKLRSFGQTRNLVDGKLPLGVVALKY